MSTYQWRWGLLVTYFLSLVFMLKTHPDFFESMGQDEEADSEGRWSLTRAVVTLLLTSVLGWAFMSEILVGAVGRRLLKP